MGASFSCPSASVLLPLGLLLSFQTFLLPPLPLPRPPNPVRSVRPRAAMLTAAALPPQTRSDFVTRSTAPSTTAQSILTKSWSRQRTGEVEGRLGWELRSLNPDTHTCDSHSVQLTSG